MDFASKKWKQNPIWQQKSENTEDLCLQFWQQVEPF